MGVYDTFENSFVPQQRQANPSINLKSLKMCQENCQKIEIAMSVTCEQKDPNK